MFAFLKKIFEKNFGSFFCKKKDHKNGAKNDPKILGHFWSFFGPFLEGPKNDQKLAQNSKKHQFFAKKCKNANFPLFFPLWFLHFLRFRIPPCQKFLGGAQILTPKMAIFWPFFRSKIQVNCTKFGPPIKNGIFGPFLTIFGGSQNTEKWGFQKWTKNWPFFDQKLIKIGGSETH